MGYKDKKYETADSEKHVAYIWGDNGNGHYTHREELYFGHLKDMLPEFKGGSVIEVGPGTGKYGVMLHNNFDIESYTVVDIEKNINDSKQTFKDNKLDGEFVMSQYFEGLFDRKFDIFISNICLSETPDYYRDTLLNNILKNCKFVLIIDGDGYKKEYNTWLTDTVKKYFTEVEIKNSGYAKCLAIAGKK
jgi:ubiquinone/menaquinone biosynthesis C-methylase UbiE